MVTRRRTSWLVAAGTSSLVVIPPLYTLLRSGPHGVFNFVRADAFLYLAVAKRSSLTWYTFDGETATNGFHPLWQFMLTALHRVIGGDTERLLVAGFLLSILVASAGVAMTSVAIFRYTGSAFLSFLTVPGVYYLTLGVGYDNWPIWSSVNCLESGVSVLCGGLALLVLSREVHRPGFTFESMYDPSFRGVAWRLGLVLPLIMLSRLDDVFVIPAFFLVFLLTPGVPFRDRIRPAFNVVAVSTVVLALYLAYNRAYAGVFLPVSGSVKGGFVLFRSLYVGLSGAFPFLIDIKEAATGRPSVPADIHANVFRFVQIIGPALMSAIYVWSVGVSHKRDPRYILPIGFAVGILVKLAYNLTYVHLWHQGSWYFALSMLMTTFFFCVLVGDAYARLDARGVAKRALHIGYAVVLVFSMGRQILSSAYVDHNGSYDFWTDRVAIQGALDRLDPDAKLLELDDGIISFSIESPSIHAFGFAADKDSAMALREGRLFAHAHERGYDIFTSNGYVAIDPQMDAESIRTRLRESGAVRDELRSELDSFDFELLWVHEPTRTGFIRFEPL